MDELIFAATLLAALGAALLAGNFFAFSAYLMRALGGLSAERGIVAMQAITRAIKAPVFLALFFGTAALCAVLLAFASLRWGAPGACTLLAGALLFLVGTFAVTMLRNTPLNTQLGAATPDTEDGREMWKRFQASWSLWNHVRTVTALLACAAFILALVAMGNPFAR
jgi:uncharacterized membrane protein